MNNSIDTPILLIVFNRLETTRQVFSQIRKTKPTKLYIASDGPRENNLNDAGKVREIRDFFERSIDWPCEINTLFRDENLGCALAVSGAIDWFFKNEESGIILEDDTVPEDSFFFFCQEMLKRYKDDERIGMISGNNWNPIQRSEFSYHFSKHGSIWGWASWRRAWDKYDFDLNLWNLVKRDDWLSGNFTNSKLATLWGRKFDAVQNGEIDTWDYRWSFARYINSYLTIRPNVNLVKNVGFGEDSTHSDKIVLSLTPAYGQSEAMEFPLKSPPFVLIDRISDEKIENLIIEQNSLRRRVKKKVFRLCYKIIKK